MLWILLITSFHLWIDILIEQSTECRVIKDIFSSVATEGPVDVVQLGEEGIGQCREEGDHPNQRNDLKEIILFQRESSYTEYLDGPGESCHGVLVEGVADGEVALHGEGQDGEHRGVARHLRDEGPGFASHLT